MKQEYKLLSSGANCDSCVKYVLLNREIGRYKNDNLSIILVKKIEIFKIPRWSINKKCFTVKLLVSLKASWVRIPLCFSWPEVTVVFICLIVKLLYVTVDFIDYIFIFVEDMGIV